MKITETVGAEIVTVQEVLCKLCIDLASYTGSRLA